MLVGKSCVLCLALLALGQQENPTYVIHKRTFTMPVQIDARVRDQIKKVRLFVSRDYGKNWALQEESPPSATKFIFKAPEDGTYWFVVQTLDLIGQLEPEYVSKAANVMRVRVNTLGRPAPTAEPPPPPAGLGKLPPIPRP